MLRYGLGMGGSPDVATARTDYLLPETLNAGTGGTMGATRKAARHTHLKWAAVAAATAVAAGGARAAALPVPQHVTASQHVAASQPLAAGQPVAASQQVAPSPLIRLAYSFVHDSNGGHPNAGAEVTLLFAANGEAFVYAGDATEAFADDGSYAYTGGRLSLHFATPDLKVQVAFPLSLSQSQVTMPFQVLSSKKGTSTWQRQTLDLDQGIFAVYNAAANTGTLNLTASQAAQRADDYARAWLASGSARGPHRRAFGAPAGQCTEQGDYCIVGTENLGDSIEIDYKNAPPVVIDLYSAGISVPGAPLALSSISSDPRVFLDPSAHPDGQFDPPNKQAVLIVPVPDLESPGALQDMVKMLRDRGYGVTELDGEAASVEGIVHALQGSPGYVVFSTHGNVAGQLLTGDSFAPPGLAQGGTKNAWQAFAAQLRSDGLGSLADYKLGTELPFLLGDPNCGFKIFPWPPGRSCSWKVEITPAFWSWLRKDRGVNLTHSLVFISACHTDTTPVLRDQIEARAYFAFSQDVDTRFATAVEDYLAESLSRPTHSPEEALYNMLRIEKSHQMIYKEDRLFNGVLGPLGSDASVAILDGWGWNGSAYVNYRGDGWLSGKVDPGQVWWMLYAMRWLKNTDDAAAKLQDCLNQYWLRGTPGGLADQYCNAANAGIPKDTSGLKLDVSYAVYLLTGKSPGGFPQSEIVPRWTMDDSA